MALYLLSDSVVSRSPVNPVTHSTKGTRKLDEYDEAWYSELLEVALSNEEPRRLHEIELLEMSYLSPKSTGLSVGIWVDEGNTFLKSGHWKRIKFKNGRGKDADLVPITVSKNPTIPLHNGKPIRLNISNKELNKIKQFIVLNLDILNRLGDDIRLSTFIKELQKV